MAKVLVVGGAGYIGSSTCAWLLDHGHDIWVLDDLSTGSEALLLNQNFTLGRAGDRVLVSKLLADQKFDCVMHFAARSLVGESREKPQEYFENNVIQTQILLDTLLAAGVREFIFSSTCAVFGDPTEESGEQGIHEGFPKKPLSPYGETKLEVEKRLEALSKQKGLRAVVLRYFNAAGAEPKLRVGECHHPETHLIPNVLKAALYDYPIEIFGVDYPTLDRTCVRDYIHVWDLAAAHGAAMELLASKRKSLESNSGFYESFNLGSETGFSVREVIQAGEKVLGKKLEVVEKPRRAGDPPRLVANSSYAKKALGLVLEKTDLPQILQSAWEWEKKQNSSVPGNPFGVSPPENVLGDSRFGSRSPKSFSGGLAKQAIFFDRDGTLNEDPGYLNNPELLKLLPRVGEALALLKKAGFFLVVVSNQSGVGRGLIDPKILSVIHQKLGHLLEPWQVDIDHYELCFHRPEENCLCRKPKPRLLVDAARKFGIDLSRSYMVGDKESDLDAGKAAGCRAFALVETGEGRNTLARIKKEKASFVGSSLLDVAQWILAQENVDS